MTLTLNNHPVDLPAGFSFTLTRRNPLLESTGDTTLGLSLPPTTANLHALGLTPAQLSYGQTMQSAHTFALSAGTLALRGTAVLSQATPTALTVQLTAGQSALAASLTKDQEKAYIDELPLGHVYDFHYFDADVREALLNTTPPVCYTPAGYSRADVEACVGQDGQLNTRGKLFLTLWLLHKAIQNEDGEHSAALVTRLTTTWRRLTTAFGYGYAPNSNVFQAFSSALCTCWSLDPGDGADAPCGGTKQGVAGRIHKGEFRYRGEVDLGLTTPEYFVYGNPHASNVLQYISRSWVSGENGNVQCGSATSLADDPCCLAPQPSLLWVLWRVLRAVGVELDYTPSDLPENLRRTFLCNVRRTMRVAEMLPHWTLKEFLTEFQNFTGCLVIIDGTTATLLPMATALDTLTPGNYTVVNASQIVDQWTDSIAADASTRSGGVSTCEAAPVRYADEEADAYVQISDEILEQATHVDTTGINPPTDPTGAPETASIPLFRDRVNGRRYAYLNDPDPAADSDTATETDPEVHIRLRRLDYGGTLRPTAPGETVRLRIVPAHSVPAEYYPATAPAGSTTIQNEARDFYNSDDTPTSPTPEQQLASCLTLPASPDRTLPTTAAGFSINNALSGNVTAETAAAAEPDKPACLYVGLMGTVNLYPPATKTGYVRLPLRRLLSLPVFTSENTGLPRPVQTTATTANTCATEAFALPAESGSFVSQQLSPVRLVDTSRTLTIQTTAPVTSPLQPLIVCGRPYAVKDLRIDITPNGIAPLRQLTLHPIVPNEF